MFDIVIEPVCTSINILILEVGKILYIGNGCFCYPKRVWVQGKGVFLPIVLYLYNSKNKVWEGQESVGYPPKTPVKVSGLGPFWIQGESPTDSEEVWF